MDGFKKMHLERLKELASNFDEDERQIVLSCIPENEIRAYLEKGAASDGDICTLSCNWR